MLPITHHPDLRRAYLAHAAEMADSPCYEQWATAVADDPDALAVIASLPPQKRQANLVFAAARVHGARPGPYENLRALILGPAWPAVRATVLARRTQTNEVGRLAALTPALGLFGDEPLALIELGASAGLCLFPDRFDYLWDGVGALRGSGGPTLTTRASGPVPVPTSHPQVVARIGVDLHPLDVTHPDDMDWLLTLIWPGHEERRHRLAAAIDVARAAPPRILAGDMLDLLDEALALAAASGGKPVVHHSAAVAYLDDDARAQVERRLRELVAAGHVHWVSMEGQRVLPALTATAPSAAAGPPSEHAFCLAVDGQAVAWAHGHGSYLTWLAGDT